MLRSAVCFVPQELSVRCHTTATETTRVMNTRRFWLDQLRILTWLVMDPSCRLWPQGRHRRMCLLREPSFAAAEARVASRG
jgi:hypothetical protein